MESCRERRDAHSSRLEAGPQSGYQLQCARVISVDAQGNGMDGEIDSVDARQSVPLHQSNGPRYRDIHIFDHRAGVTAWDQKSIGSVRAVGEGFAGKADT